MLPYSQLIVVSEFEIALAAVNYISVHCRVIVFTHKEHYFAPPEFIPTVCKVYVCGIFHMEPVNISLVLHEDEISHALFCYS